MQPGRVSLWCMRAGGATGDEVVVDNVVVSSPLVVWLSEVRVD